MRAVDVCMKKLLSDIVSFPAFVSLASNYASLAYSVSLDYSAARLLVLSLNNEDVRDVFSNDRYLRYCLVSSLYAQTGEGGLMLLILQDDILASSPANALSMILVLSEEAHFLVFCSAGDQSLSLNHSNLFCFHQSVLSSELERKSPMVWMSAVYLYLREWLMHFERDGFFDSGSPMLFTCPWGYPIFREKQDGRFICYRKPIAYLQERYPECLYRLNALPYMHILKQVLRNKVGRFNDAEDILCYLQEALSPYVSHCDAIALYRLSSAHVGLSEEQFSERALFMIQLSFPEAVPQNFKLGFDYVSA